jgi:succinate dehydrogenase/fumarate reductase flavoprotein subunit
MAVQILPKRSNTALAIPQASDLIAGELAMNVADGKFYTKTTGGVVKEVGGAGAVTLQDVTTTGAVTNNDITLDGADIIFEGALANAYETTLTVAEPTADRTVTLPNQSGTLAMDGDALAYAIVFGG